jgi:protein-disulfide isomerase-like protein with CxxC motif
MAIMKAMDDIDNIELSQSRDGPRNLDVKDQLSVVLKEYDALRKQVDQGSAFMQGLVIPISVALGGTMIGWQGKIPPELAILAVPVLVMGGLAAAQNGEAYTEESGQMLAGVENRVFQMTGMPLLCHETRLAAKRKAAGGGGWWCAVVLISATYTICELWLWSALGDRAFYGVSKDLRTVAVVAVVAAAAPILSGVVMAIRFQRSRRKWALTPLARYLAQTKAC